MTTHSDRTSQTLTLRDGRVLSYAEWGDPDGKVVFYFTSSEASRYSRHPDETILTDLGIRLFTFDRPGRGGSTPHKGRRLLDWADDIREFLRHQHIQRFAMIGHSQGCAHCLACAYALPELVNSMVLVTAAAGFDDANIMRQQGRYLRTQHFMSRYAPGLMSLQWNMLRSMLKGKRGEKMLLDNLRALPERDQATANIPGGTEVMIQSMREGLRQGGAGITEDFRLVAKEWGFKLEGIQTKAFIWHGEADTMMHWSMSRYLAEHLPHAELNIVPEEGNLLIYSRWRDILAQCVIGM